MTFTVFTVKNQMSAVKPSKQRPQHRNSFDKAVCRAATGFAGSANYISGSRKETETTKHE